MDVLLKAKELGESLADSSVIKRLKNAEAELENDERGMALMEDHRLLQVELIKATREKNSEVELNDIKGLLIDKQKELDEYQMTHEYLESKNEFDILMKNINDIITHAVTGGECSPSQCASCSGGCGSHQ